MLLRADWCNPDNGQVKQRVAVHVPCSSKKMGVSDAFTQLAAMCADEVVPSGVPCCGESPSTCFCAPTLKQQQQHHE